MVTKPGKITYSLSPLFRGEGWGDLRTQFPNRIVLGFTRLAPRRIFRGRGLTCEIPDRPVMLVGLTFQGPGRVDRHRMPDGTEKMGILDMVPVGVCLG
jgi:hypothetical protein